MKIFILFLSAVTLFVAETAQACSVCFFGDPTNQANIALRLSIVTLLAILVIILGLFIKFFYSIFKRSRLLNGEG